MLCAAPFFSDNMVLQQGKPVSVWGTGAGNSIVHVCWESDQNKITVETKVRNGAWAVKLPPLNAGLTGELSIRDETNEIRFRNVITGDVWFAGGQSNMEMELINCHNGSAELAACANPNIRFYQMVKRAVVDDDYLREEAQTRWQICAPETAAMLSAVAFFFARKINTDLKIPIGIILCSWGGSSISTWMSKEQLQRSCAGQRFIDNYDARIGGKTDAQYDVEMEEYFSQWRAWDERIRNRQKKEPGVSWETLNKECGECPWPQPAGNKSPYRPTNLHTALVRRIAPFTLKGFLYYQGEEDDQRAADYREMMYYLVQQWRNDWGDATLPFLFVQLPMYASREEMESGNPPRHWCLIRESQYEASQDIAHSALAVIIDCGESDNIHPLNKQTPGFRLALQALKKVYGQTDIEADGPIFSWLECTDGALRIHFDHAQSGLEFRGEYPTGEVAGFEIAAIDGHYYPAHAVIDGSDVIIRSDKVTEPCRARYAWYKFGATPLYAKNGLPAMPFRSCTSEPADA